MRLVIEVKERGPGDILDENGRWWTQNNPDTTEVFCHTQFIGKMVSGDLADGGMGDEDGPEITITNTEEVCVYIADILA
jgi:hypothetical protein